MLQGFPGGASGKESESENLSIVSDSLRPQGLYSLWNSPGQNTGVGNLSLLQGIFPTQGSNPGLLHCRQILYQGGKELTCNAGDVRDMSSISGAGRSPREGKGYPLQYSCLDNPMDKGA